MTSAYLDASRGHLWGAVDPSDGIPFRPPAAAPRRGGAGARRQLDDRCIYRKRDRLRVMVRVAGRLRQVGYYANLRDARAARDGFWRRLYGPRWRQVVAIGTGLGRRRFLEGPAKAPAKPPGGTAQALTQ